MLADSEEKQPQPTTSELLGGIMSDLQQLIDQQFHLTWLEMEEESHLLKAALGMVALGATITSLGALTGCLMLVHLLHWLTSPPNLDAASLPLWVCHALVAALLVAGGAALVQIGRLRLKLWRFAGSHKQSLCGSIDHE